MDHRKSIEEERGLAEFSFDYSSPGNELGYKVTILVGRERGTGMTMATVLTTKEPKGKFAADRALEYFQECGNGVGDIIVKTDQEPAIKYLVKDIVLERAMKRGAEPSWRRARWEARAATAWRRGRCRRSRARCG